jgi:hypothetical protein
MKSMWSKIAAGMLFLCTVFLAILAFKSIYFLLYFAPQGSKAQIDFSTIVVVLLTTVTVVFSVCAIALAIIGAIGFKNLKSEAGNFAAEQVVRKIQAAFSQGGVALTQIDTEFSRGDGHLRPWMEERIRKEVILLMPLVADRLRPEAQNGMASGEPTDEGETN